MSAEAPSPSSPQAAAATATAANSPESFDLFKLVESTIDGVRSMPKIVWLNVATGAAVGSSVGSAGTLIYFQSVLAASDPSKSATPWSNAEIGAVAAAAIVGGFPATALVSRWPRTDHVTRMKQMSLLLSLGILIAWIGWLATSQSAIFLAIVWTVLVGPAFAALVVMPTPMTNAMLTNERHRGFAAVIYQLAMQTQSFVIALVAFLLGENALVGSSAVFLLGIASGVASWYAITQLEPLISDFLSKSVTVADEKKQEPAAIEQPQQEEMSPTALSSPAPMLPSSTPATAVSVLSTAAAEEKYSAEFKRDCLICGLLIGSALQNEGINYVTALAPALVSAAGVSALLGNVLLLLVNALFVVVSLVVIGAARWATESVFFYCLVGLTVSCGFISVSYAVNSNVLAMLSLCAYLATFEIGIGTCYYYVVQETQIPELRTQMTALINGFQFVFSLSTFAFTPTVVGWLTPSISSSDTTLSAAGNNSSTTSSSTSAQSTGISRMFLIFAALGAGNCLLLGYYLPRSYIAYAAKQKSAAIKN